MLLEVPGLGVQTTMSFHLAESSGRGSDHGGRLVYAA